MTLFRPRVVNFEINSQGLSAANALVETFHELFPETLLVKTVDLPEKACTWPFSAMKSFQARAFAATEPSENFGVTKTYAGLQIRGSKFQSSSSNIRELELTE